MALAFVPTTVFGPGDSDDWVLDGVVSIDFKFAVKIVLSRFEIRVMKCSYDGIGWIVEDLKLEERARQREPGKQTL